MYAISYVFIVPHDLHTQAPTGEPSESSLISGGFYGDDP